MVVVWIIAGLVALVFVWLALAKLLARVFPFPMPHRVSFILESWPRRITMPARTTLNRMGLAPGMVAVEVGPGTGYFTFEVAKRLKPGGRLVCVDVQPQMIERIREKIAHYGADNIETYVASAEKLPLEDSGADFLFLISVLGEVKEESAVLTEAYRVLKPAGVLSVSEFLPDPHYRTKSEVRRLASGAGFEPVSVKGNFFVYTANFRKPENSERITHR